MVGSASVSIVLEPLGLAPTAPCTFGQAGEGAQVYPSYLGQ